MSKAKADVAICDAGLKAQSIDSGLPVGLHAVGNYFAEGGMLRAAHHYQRATDWHARRPALPGV